ncbi:hypothetical protein PBI_SCHIEBS_3 [Gordonia phage Schiebs]|nr:hypothetical protein PBI_SCHIEBS_3 [Gordonia phage Schiebs]
MSETTVTIDRSTCSFVPVCSCGEWRTVTTELGSAWIAAARHLRLDHNDLHGGRLALNAARKARKRAHRLHTGQHESACQGA